MSPTRPRPWTWTLAAGLIGLLACESEPAEKVRTVPTGAFAVVGESALSVGLLAFTGDDHQKGAHGLIHDELYRQSAHGSAPERARVVERGVLARSLLEDLLAKEERERPVTKDDILAAKAAAWVEFDRPRSVRTAQVFVAVQELADDRGPYAVAERILAAVQGSKQGQQFAERAQAAVTPEERIILGMLPPVASDGRVVPIRPEDGQFPFLTKEIGQAAAALAAPGDMSGIVGTEQGFHILFALEVISEYRPPLEEIESELRVRVVSNRASARQAEVLAKAKVPVRRVREDVGTLLRQVQIDP